LRRLEGRDDRYCPQDPFFARTRPGFLRAQNERAVLRSSLRQGPPHLAAYQASGSVTGHPARPVGIRRSSSRNTAPLMYFRLSIVTGPTSAFQTSVPSLATKPTFSAWHFDSRQCRVGHRRKGDVMSARISLPLGDMTSLLFRQDSWFHSSAGHWPVSGLQHRRDPVAMLVSVWQVGMSAVASVATAWRTVAPILDVLVQRAHPPHLGATIRSCIQKQTP